MIRKYQSFFESITIKLSIEKALKNFCETLIECEKYLRDNSESPAYSSYSYVAQESKGDIDPEVNFHEVDEYMSKNGWDLKTVKELSDGLTNFADTMERAQVSQSAAIDYYLYKVTNKKFPLQGYVWDLRAMGDSDPEVNEYLIRFSYGWHKTKYGKLVICQNMESVESFILTVFGYLSDYIIMTLTNLYKLTCSETDRKKIGKNFFSDKDIKNDEIYIDSENLFTELKQLNPSVWSKGEKEKLLSLSQDDFDKTVFNLLLNQYFKPRIILTGDIKVSL
jgi:hypothetical protein